MAREYAGRWERELKTQLRPLKEYYERKTREMVAEQMAYMAGK